MISVDVKALAAEIVAAMPPQQQLPKLFSLQAVADLLDCSSEHVRSLIEAGQLEAVNIAEDPTTRKSLRVTGSSVAGFAETRKIP